MCRAIRAIRGSVGESSINKIGGVLLVLLQSLVMRKALFGDTEHVSRPLAYVQILTALCADLDGPYVQIFTAPMCR